MTSQSDNTKKPNNRKYILLLVGVTLVIAAWSSAWFYGQTFVSDEIDAQIQQLSKQGLEVTCADRRVAGYPFRFEISCNDMLLKDKWSRELAVSALDAVTLVYNPRHVIFEAESPAKLAIPHLETDAQIDWASARASIKASLTGLSTLDAIAENVSLETSFNKNLRQLFASKLEVHLREAPNTEGLLETFITIDQLGFQNTTKPEEAIDLRAYTKIQNGMDLLAGSNIPLLVQANEGALPVKLMLFEAVYGQSKISTTGDITINGNGTLSGRLDTSIENANALLPLLEKLEFRDQQTRALIEGFLKSVSSSSTESGSTNQPSIPIIIDEGLLRVGFLPIGYVPPLFSAGL